MNRNATIAFVGAVIIILLAVMLLSGCSGTRVSMCLADCRLEADPQGEQVVVVDGVQYVRPVRPIYK